MKPPTLSPTSIPIVFLCLLLVLYHVGGGACLAYGVKSIDTLRLLYQVGLSWSVVWWLKEDSRKYGVKPVYCLGFLVGIGWFIVLPYHVYKTRGVKGILNILAVILMFLGAFILGAITYASLGVIPEQ